MRRSCATLRRSTADAHMHIEEGGVDAAARTSDAASAAVPVAFGTPAPAPFGASAAPASEALSFQASLDVGTQKKARRKLLLWSGSGTIDWDATCTRCIDRACMVLFFTIIIAAVLLEATQGELSSAQVKIDVESAVLLEATAPLKIDVESSPHHHPTMGFTTRNYGAFSIVRNALTESECAVLRTRITNTDLNTRLEIDGETVYDTFVDRSEFPWLQERLQDALGAVFSNHTGLYLSEQFAREYCVERRNDFVPHIDGSDVSVIVRLSQSGAFSGGGVATFENASSAPESSYLRTLSDHRNEIFLRDVLADLDRNGELDKHKVPLENCGDILIFRNDGPAGQLLHTVLPVTNGIRHSFIAFYIWSDSSSEEVEADIEDPYADPYGDPYGEYYY